MPITELIDHEMEVNMEKILAKMDAKFDAMEKSLSHFKWTIGLLFALLTAAMKFL